ncbi:MAG TPA: c-type cytochrome domain-containing protein, partial [Armatimonadota bacterium]|nr:c-type cytochrome domain-containing protein [Armatimonadota bacterium]
MSASRLRLWLGLSLGASLCGGSLAALSAPSVPASSPRPAAAPAFTREQIEFFEKSVRPVLAESCIGCHQSALKSPQGELRLDSRAAILHGGSRGPAVVPGSPEKSLLLKAVGYRDPGIQMPPRGKLPDEKIAALEQWVRMGAPWPAEAKPAGAAPRPAGFDVRARANHWAFAR